jgi:hypothetical protein
MEFCLCAGAMMNVSNRKRECSFVRSRAIYRAWMRATSRRRRDKSRGCAGKRLPFLIVTIHNCTILMAERKKKIAMDLLLSQQSITAMAQDVNSGRFS